MEKFAVPPEARVYKFTPAEGLDQVDLMLVSQVIEIDIDETSLALSGVAWRLSPNHHRIPHITYSGESKWTLHRVHDIGDARLGFAGLEDEPDAYGLIVPSKSVNPRPTHASVSSVNPLRAIRKAAEDYRFSVELEDWLTGDNNFDTSRR